MQACVWWWCAAAAAVVGCRRRRESEFSTIPVLKKSSRCPNSCGGGAPRPPRSSAVAVAGNHQKSPRETKISITSKSDPPNSKNSITHKPYMAIPKIPTMDTQKIDHIQIAELDPSRAFLKPCKPGPSKTQIPGEKATADDPGVRCAPPHTHTQIPGEGDSRRPRRPRRTTTHTHRGVRGAPPHTHTAGAEASMC